MPEEKIEKQEKKVQGLKKRLTLKIVLDAIERTGGKVAETIRVLGINPLTFYRNWRYLPEVEEALQQFRQMGFEEVTDTIFEQAKNGNLKAAHIYLRYSPTAKKNDWTDNQTLTIKEDKPLSDAEKEQLKKDLFGM